MCCWLLNPTMLGQHIEEVVGCIWTSLFKLRYTEKLQGVTNSQVYSAYLIFVTSTTTGACGEKICYVEKFVHITDWHVEKFLHMRNVNKIYHVEKVLHMINVEQNVLFVEMWRILSCGEMFRHDRFLHMSNEKCGANLWCGEIFPPDIFLHTSNMWRKFSR